MVRAWSCIAGVGCYLKESVCGARRREEGREGGKGPAVMASTGVIGGIPYGPMSLCIDLSVIFFFLIAMCFYLTTTFSTHRGVN